MGELYRLPDDASRRNEHDGLQFTGFGEIYPVPAHPSEPFISHEKIERVLHKGHEIIDFVDRHYDEETEDVLVSTKKEEYEYSGLKAGVEMSFGLTRDEVEALLDECKDLARERRASERQ